MCKSLPFVLFLAHLEEHCPFVGATTKDATEIIHNAGKTEGWLCVSRYARKLHLSPPQPTPQSTEPKRLYQEQPAAEASPIGAPRPKKK